MNPGITVYFDDIADERKERFNILHSLIIKLYPDAVLDRSYKMPTYRVGDGWVALANQKNYIPLYACGYHHIELFKASHPSIKTGKGCINFKDNDSLPLQDIEKVTCHAIKQPKPG